jgi:TonB family protein
MVKVVKPLYPGSLKLSEVEGTVVIDAVIDDAGKVVPGTVRILQSVHRLLDQASVDALLASRFSPALYNGHPVGVIMQIPYTYRFNSDRPKETAGPAAPALRGLSPDRARAALPDYDPPELVFMPKPRIPDDLKGRIIPGTGVLRLRVGVEGLVEPSSLKVVRRLDPELDNIAIRAVGSSRFKPALLRNRPIATTIEMPYTYESLLEAGAGDAEGERR